MKSVPSTYFLRIFFFFFQQDRNENFFLQTTKTAPAICSWRKCNLLWQSHQQLPIAELNSKGYWSWEVGSSERGEKDCRVFTLRQNPPILPIKKKQQQILSLMENSRVVGPEYQKKFISGHSQQRNLSLKPEFYCFYQPITKGVHRVNIVLP